VELAAILFMLVAGAGLAVFTIAAFTIAKREEEHAGGARPQQQTAGISERDRIGASLLVTIVTAGGVSRDDALRAVRRGAGLAAPVTGGIDVSNWAEAYARIATKEQRGELLEMAVQLVASRERPVPLRQYSALLDLSFGLGFQTDALARLRTQYGFDYIDHAKDGRPKEADRGGASAPLYERAQRPAPELLRLLGLTGTPTRQELTAAYRKLVAQHHPDRFHNHPEAARNEAAGRFIEITRAYEELLLTYRD
jgi:hypothetical protein